MIELWSSVAKYRLAADCMLGIGLAAIEVMARKRMNIKVPPDGLIIRIIS
jgi:hypothetical protein